MGAVRGGPREPRPTESQQLFLEELARGHSGNALPRSSRESAVRRGWALEVHDRPGQSYRLTPAGVDVLGTDRYAALCHEALPVGRLGQTAVAIGHAAAAAPALAGLRAALAELARRWDHVHQPPSPDDVHAGATAGDTRSSDASSQSAAIEQAVEELRELLERVEFRLPDGWSPPRPAVRATPAPRHGAAALVGGNMLFSAGGDRFGLVLGPLSRPGETPALGAFLHDRHGEHGDDVDVFAAGAVCRLDEDAARDLTAALDWWVSLAGSPPRHPTEVGVTLDLLESELALLRTLPEAQLLPRSLDIGEAERRLGTALFAVCPELDEGAGVEPG